MTTYRDCNKKRKIASLISAALFCLPGLSHADDEQAKSMTLNLIQALVDSGTLTRENANRLIATAQAKAKAQAGPEFKSSYSDSGSKNRAAFQPAAGTLPAVAVVSDSEAKALALIQLQAVALAEAQAQSKAQIDAMAQVQAQAKVQADAQAVAMAEALALVHSQAQALAATQAQLQALTVSPSAVATKAPEVEFKTRYDKPVAVAAAAATAAAATTGAAYATTSAVPVARSGAAHSDAAAIAAANAAIAAADKATAAAQAAVEASNAIEASALNAANSAAAAYASYVANSALIVPPQPPSLQQLSAPVVVAIGSADLPQVGADGKNVVRVAYIPEATKTAMREQIKQEVLAQSKAEKWGDPGALPSWLRHVNISGDVRVRDQYVKLNPANTAAGIDYSDGVFTRAANIVGGSFNGTLPNFDTQSNYDFWSVRGRLNIDGKVNDQVSTGFTISTGNTGQRTTLNQNLGQNFNNYGVVLDKVFIKYDPAPWLSISGGRIGNPFFSTDLLFADDVNFEGLAATTRYELTPDLIGYATAGYFPLRMNNPGISSGRSMGALQAGIDWEIAPHTQLKLGAALYDYVNVVGTAEDNTTQVSVSDYVTRYEYPATFRQMGNTLFVINAPADQNINWGLASKFKELDLMAALDLGAFGANDVLLTSDYVKNLGFKADDIFKRTGYHLLDGKSTGYQEKILVGTPVIKEPGTWNVSLAYRYLGSDAVLDAFVNPDFGLGSTNTKGTIFTGSYGIARNTWITGRYLSSNLIDSMVPQHSLPAAPATKLNVDTVQIELNARF